MPKRGDREFISDIKEATERIRLWANDKYFYAGQCKEG